MEKTPRANRLHIGIYGRRNAGKSSLINELTGQKVALVSEVAGTTTDPVYKSMELPEVGAVTFIDTAGYDDEGELGALRVKKTEETIAKADLAILLKKNDHDEQDGLWLRKLEAAGVKTIIYGDSSGVSSIDELLYEIKKIADEKFSESLIVGDLVDDGELVVLVMPQDIQAPRGRLILPQVQTIRELLDRKCTVISSTADRFEVSLDRMGVTPSLVITDSQCFATVSEILNEKYGNEVRPKLTSFSILFAAYKGDIGKFVDGAAVLDKLLGNPEKSEKSEAGVKSEARGERVRILIAEACTHVPQGEDIGRVKLPRLLRKYFAEAGAPEPEIVNVCGGDFPELMCLQDFDLIVHCGACMFNRSHVLSRIAQAEAAGVPISNYGVLLAKLTGILDKVALPK